MTRLVNTLFCSFLLGAWSQTLDNDSPVHDMLEEETCQGQDEECALSLRQLRATQSSAKVDLHTNAPNAYAIAYADAQNNMSGITSDHDPDDPEDPANNVTG